jgi:hypothetical protein
MLAHKAVRVRYYWPTMNWDSSEMVKHCDKCERLSKVDRRPSAELSSISSPWPFTQWGVDIVGPMPLGKGNCRFLVVAVDYFTKWAEVEPLETITIGAMKNFLWKPVVFGTESPTPSSQTMLRNSIANHSGTGVLSFVFEITFPR